MPPTSDKGITAFDLIAHQTLLEAQAREAIPFSYSRAACTWDQGYIRQPLWACRDCKGIHVCAGCSIGCHADHDLIELFAKRMSRCDCGAAKDDDSKPCNLRKPPLNFVPENDSNTYTKNHEGHFCYCPRGWTYDPLEEAESMFQCLVCEEWFHETCTSLRPAPKEQISDGQGASEATSTAPPDEEGPPPLISHEAFDSLICDVCVRRHPILHHYVGQKQWGVCLEADGRAKGEGEGETSKRPVGFGDDVVVRDRDGSSRTYTVTGLPTNLEEYDAWNLALTSSGKGHKRELSTVVEDDETAETDAKRAKVDRTEQASTDDTTGDATLPVDIPKETLTDTSAELTKGDESSRRISDSTCAADVGIGEATPRSPSCRLPSVLPQVRTALALENGSRAVVRHENNPDDTQRLDGRLDVFLDEGGSECENLDGAGMYGWRGRICRCTTCLPHFAVPELAGILQEEETYEPPASPQPEAAQGQECEGDDNGDDASSSAGSSYDMAMSALSSLPRAQTLEALQGYARLREALFEHLKPFAREGRMVDEASVKDFFAEWKEKERTGR